MGGKKALLIIDYQNDFCEGGALPVEGAKALLQPINELIARGGWDLVVASKDWHPEGHISFASSHAGKAPYDAHVLQGPNGQSFATTLWPDHCIDGSPGAKLVTGLNKSELDKIMYKGQQQSAEFYSAFSDVFGNNDTDLDALLRQRGIDEVVVVGLALDYCVMHTALEAVRKGYRTEVDLDCTRAVAPQTGEQALRRLQEAGVQLLHEA